MDVPTLAWTDAASQEAGPPSPQHPSSPLPPKGPQPHLSFEGDRRRCCCPRRFLGVVPARTHLLLEQEPEVLQCVRFLRAEVFLGLESPLEELSDSAFGLPDSSDVLLSVCQAGPTLSENDLAELQGSVRGVKERLMPGCRCFLFCDCLCRKAGVDFNGGGYTRLRLRVFLYADIVIDLGLSEGKSYKPAVSLGTIVSVPSSGTNLPRSSTCAELPMGHDTSCTSSASCSVGLFGPTATIPADQCGRVCLERLVTMAKAAMVGEGVPIDQFFVSRSPAVRACIRRGQRALSQASLGSGSSPTAPGLERRGSVSSVLDAYVNLLPSGQSSSCDIAGTFVASLASNWNREQRLQQTRFARFVRGCLQSAKDYAMNWLTLSPQRVRTIKAGSTRDPKPALLVGLLPPVIAALVYAVPYNRPDAGYPTDGFMQNLLWVFYCWPITQFPCWFLFPEWVRMSAFPEMSRLKMCLWNCCTILVISSAIAGFSIGTGIFPVPFLTVVNISLVVPFLPFIWFCIPRETRNRPGSKHRLLWSAVGLLLLISIFGVFFPLFNSVFNALDGIYQDFLVIIFLLTRLLFENINKLLAKKLGPDMFPLAVAMAVYAYEFSMCVMMGSIKHTVVLVMLIGVDAFENTFHLWRLWRTRNEPHSEGSRLCIISVVLLREFVELVVPTQVVAVILAVHGGPAKPFNELVSVSPSANENFSVREQRMLIYLGIDILAEGIVFVWTCALLVAQGLKPLRLLRGVLNANAGSYFSIAMACVMFYLQLQHSHFGCDFSFRFLWASQEDNVFWDHGTEWSV